MGGLLSGKYALPKDMDMATINRQRGGYISSRNPQQSQKQYFLNNIGTMLAQGLPQAFGTITNYIGRTSSSSTDSSSSDDSKERAKDKERLTQIDAQIKSILSSGGYTSVDALNKDITDSNTESTRLTTEQTNKTNAYQTCSETYTNCQKNTANLRLSLSAMEANLKTNPNDTNLQQQVEKLKKDIEKAEQDEQKAFQDMNNALNELNTVNLNISILNNKIENIKSIEEELKPLLEEKQKINEKWQARRDDPESDAATDQFNQNLSNLTNFNTLLATFNANPTDKKTAKKLKEIAENAQDNKTIQNAYDKIKDKVEAALQNNKTK